MKKSLKLTVWILCVALLSGGCGHNGVDTGTQPPASVPTEITVPTGPALLEPIPSVSIEYETISLTPQDRAIVYYGDCDFDYCFDAGGSSTYRIYIVSKTPIDPNTIKADALGTDMETITVTDNTDDFSYDVGNGTMNVDYCDYLYQTQHGMDWKEAGSLFIEDWEASMAMLSTDTPTKEAYEKSQEASERYNSYMTQHLEAYMQEKEAYMNQFPYFYYIVRINFGTPFDIYETDPNLMETVNQIILEVEGERHELSIGEIRLHPYTKGSANTPYSPEKGMSDYRAGSITFLHPWNRGHFDMLPYFTADTDITLKRVELVLSGETTIERITIQQSGVGGNFEMEWDGDSDLHVDQGNKAQLCFELFDPDMAGRVNYCDVVHMIIYYTTPEGEHSWLITQEIIEEQNPYDLCAQYLEGVDLRSYFADYYNVVEYYSTIDIGRE